VTEARDVAAIVEVLDFDARVLDRALDFVGSAAGVRGRDAVHAATALVHGIGFIASIDKAFDAVPGLSRIDQTET
jgi:predicted nucleic acid-binding protein